MHTAPKPLDEKDLIRLEFNLGGRTHPFYIPPSQNQLQAVREIFNGENFPDLPIDNANVDLVLDIGGNIGASAVFFIMRYSNATVHCFEPNPWIWPVLRRNVAGHPNIEIHEYGLSNQTSIQMIDVVGKAGEMSSFRNKFNEVEGHLEARLENAAEVLSRLAPGDQQIVAKIDTEGFEPEVLEGLEPFLDKIQVLYMSFHAESQRRHMDALLARHGFILFSGDISRPHRGELNYIREDIVNNIPALDQYRND